MCERVSELRCHCKVLFLFLSVSVWSQVSAWTYHSGQIWLWWKILKSYLCQIKSMPSTLVFQETWNTLVFLPVFPFWWLPCKWYCVCRHFSFSSLSLQKLVITSFSWYYKSEILYKNRRLTQTPELSLSITFYYQLVFFFTLFMPFVKFVYSFLSTVLNKEKFLHFVFC